MTTETIFNPQDDTIQDKQAHQSIHNDELKQALNDGAISQEQVRDFKQSKNMLEMESKRESSLEDSHQTRKGHQI